MLKNGNNETKIITTKQIVFMALMVALSIVFGKFLALNFTDMIRVSFENLPIILAAIILGPARGAIVALVADLLGCLLRGYVINPAVTIGAVVFALVVGIVFKYIPTRGLLASITLSILPAHLLGSVLIKTIGLASFYLSSYDMGIGALVALRLLVYGLTSAGEIFIIVALLKNKAFSRLVYKIQKGE